MRLLKILVGLISLNILIISGCGGGGGGGGGGDTGKTARLIFSSFSVTTPPEQLGGFELTAILPAGASIRTDAAGVPLSTAVYLSGEFSGAPLLGAVFKYDKTQRLLTVVYGDLSLNSHDLGEFLTVICDVPSSYSPNPNDVITTFTAISPFSANPGGAPMPAVKESHSFI